MTVAGCGRLRRGVSWMHEVVKDLLTGVVRGAFTVPSAGSRLCGSLARAWLTPLGTMSSPGQNAASCSRVSPDRPILSMVRARSAAKSSPATMEAMWITASMVGVGTDRCRARSVRNTIE